MPSMSDVTKDWGNVLTFTKTNNQTSSGVSYHS